MLLQPGTQWWRAQLVPPRSRVRVSRVSHMFPSSGKGVCVGGGGRLVKVAGNTDIRGCPYTRKALTSPNNMPTNSVFRRTINTGTQSADRFVQCVS